MYQNAGINFRIAVIKKYSISIFFTILQLHYLLIVLLIDVHHYITKNIYAQAMSDTKISPEEILLKIQDLSKEQNPSGVRKGLLNAFLNLALIAPADFVATSISREDTLLAVYEEILIWEE